MFIGHFALGLASKKITKSPSLAVMFIAVQFLDLLWPILVILGIEKLQIDVGNTALTPLEFVFYPFSHSLIAAVFWGGTFGFIYYLITKNRKSSLLLFCLVISHWILDLLTHGEDLPISPNNDFKVGFGLWNHPVLESIIEFGLFIFGSVFYYMYAKPKRKIIFWVLILMLLTIHVMNIIGPPPPSTDMVAWSANLMWIFIFFAWWLEREPTNLNNGPKIEVSHSR